MTIRLPRPVRRLTGKLVTARTLAAKPYALYRDPAGCDSTTWGRPKARCASLAEAMSAAGTPDRSAWMVDADQDETYADLGRGRWVILGPGKPGPARPSFFDLLAEYEAPEPEPATPASRMCADHKHIGCDQADCGCACHKLARAYGDAS